MTVYSLYAPVITGGMDAVMGERPTLATAVERWRIEQRLEWTQLARLAGISRGTLNNVRLGKSVNSDTLRKIALGLATHPHTGEFDAVVHARALRELFDVSGLIADDQLPRPDLRASVAEVVGAGRTADQVDVIVRDLAKLPPHLQDRWIDMARIAMLGIRADT